MSLCAMIFRLLTLLVWVSAFSWAWGQSLHFTQIGVREGLSQTSVTALVQDPTGFLWIGTQDGLNRYDGYQFIVYRHRPGDTYSLPDSMISALAVSADGRVWVGAPHGLCYYEPDYDRFVTVKSMVNGAAEGISNIQTLFVDTRNKLWIGTRGGGLFEMDLNQPEALPRNSPGLNDYCRSVWTISENARGDLLLATSRGLVVIDVATGKKRVMDKIYPWAASRISAFGENREGAQWVGTVDGTLIHMDSLSHDHQMLKVPDSREKAGRKVTGIREVDGLLLVGTSSGLVIYDLAMDRWLNANSHADSLDDAEITTVFEDRSGTVWVGSVTLGLNRFNRLFGKGLFRNVMGKPGELSGNHISSFWMDGDGTLWVGTLGGGLNRKKSGEHRFEVFRHDPDVPGSLPGDTVSGLLRDREGTLWIALGADGLARFDDRTGLFIPVAYAPGTPSGLTERTPRILAQHVDHEIWIGGNSGLTLMNTSSDSFSRYYNIPGEENSLSSNEVRSLYFDSKGNPWVGTYGGLNVIDRSTGRITHFRSDPDRADALSNDRVTAIVADPSDEDVIWLGTWGGGLNRFDKQARVFRNFRESDGLANEVVYAILPDAQGYLWMSTNKGISRFDPVTRRFANWGESDGLQSDEFNLGSAMLTSEGHMYFGGINGFNVFQPEEMRTNLIPPVPVIESLSFYNRPVQPRWRDPDSPLEVTIQRARELVLPFSRNYFTLSFAGLHFMDPEKNRFRYMLAGEDQDWTEVDATRRFATYTNIDPGSYQFKVFASNGDGTWSEEPAELRIRVLPPPWLSRWAIAFYVLLLLALGFGYWSGQKQARERLRQMVEARTRELRDKNEALKDAQQALMEAAHNAGMAEIATDVLHNVGNALNSVRISGHLIKEVADKRKSVDFLQRLVELVDKEGSKAEFFTRRGPQIKEALFQVTGQVERNYDILESESNRLMERLENTTRVLRAQEQHSQLDIGIQGNSDLNDIVRGVVRLKRGSLPENLIVLNEELETIPRVHIDPSKVMRILVYLLKNAIEAIEDSGRNDGMISVCTKHLRNRVVLEVTDNGIGIPHEHLDQVFEQGFSTKSDFAGFGLHYSANAMNQMNGTMAIYSGGEGKGTKVTLQFPPVD